MLSYLFKSDTHKKALCSICTPFIKAAVTEYYLSQSFNEEIIFTGKSVVLKSIREKNNDEPMFVLTFDIFPYTDFNNPISYHKAYLKILKSTGKIEMIALKKVKNYF